MPNDYENFNGSDMNNSQNYNQYYNQNYYSSQNTTNSYQYASGPVVTSNPYSQTMRYSMKDVMSRTFLYMTIALLLTAISAMAVYTTNPYFLVTNGMSTFILLAIVEVGVVIGASFAVKANNAFLAGVLFIIYSIVNGLTLSVILLVYTEASIAKVFFLTAGLFGVMAVMGFTTNRDLTSMGSLLMIGLFGIIIGSLINLFLHSTGLDYFITIAGIAIFLGLTAYDTQKIKHIAMNNPGYSLSTIALYGAIELYLDFINLFLKLLRLLGKARN